MSELIILTGPVHTGKSTALMQWAQQRQEQGAIVRGIINPTIDGKKIFINASTNESFAMEHGGSADDPPLHIGKYTFSTQAFDRARNIVATESKLSADLFILDEVGKLELNGDGLEPAVSMVLSQKAELPHHRLLVVVRDYLLDKAIERWGLQAPLVIGIESSPFSRMNAALILCGGLSSRMGTNKHTLDYGQGPHWKTLQNILTPLFKEIYISCREDQKADFDGAPCILDRWQHKGPMAAIASAMQQQTEIDHWFVVSCDLPFFNINIAHALLERANTSALVTLAQVKGNSYPEPLVAVWNRTALPSLLDAIQHDALSLQNLIPTLPHTIVEFADEMPFLNVNSREEYESLMKGMRST